MYPLIQETSLEKELNMTLAILIFAATYVLMLTFS